MGEQQRKSRPDVVCPYANLDETSQVIRRKDIRELGDDFKKALRPLSTLVDRMKEQNIDSRHTKKRMVWVVRWLIMLSVGGLAVLAMLYVANRMMTKAALLMDESNLRQKQMQDEQRQLFDELKKLTSVAKETKKTVEGIEEEQEEKAKVELVPETDPVKALHAPVKVRILPSRKSKSPLGDGKVKAPSPAQSAVEFPIPKHSVTKY
jgi:hypothetical protein